MKFLKFWFPVAIYSVMIFSASAIPGSQVPSEIGHFDKIVHGLEYSGLSLLFMRALAVSWPQGTPLWRGVLTLAFIVFYGITDEFHQRFVPGRTCDSQDLLADSCGGLLGVLIFFALKQLWRKRLSCNDNHQSVSSRSL